MKTFTKYLSLVAICVGLCSPTLALDPTTYDGTAGTGGSTDKGTLYSITTGDGAVASATVPLEFAIEKKVAIAVKDQNGQISHNPLFYPFQWNANMPSTYNRNSELKFEDNTSLYEFSVVGIIYSTTDVIISFNMTDFVHESTPSSIVNRRKAYTEIYDGAWSLSRKDGSTTSEDPNIRDGIYEHIHTLGQNRFIPTDNKLIFQVGMVIYEEDIPIDSHPGKYKSIVTITMTMQ